MYPLVYISVLNWNAAHKTIACVKSINTLDYPRFTVIIVDNGSSDDSVAQLREEFPEAELICAEHNLGYAGGNKLALDRALQDESAELFWILNNDTIVQPSSLSALVSAYQQWGEGIYGSVPITHGSDGQALINNSYFEFVDTRHTRLTMRKLINRPLLEYFPSLFPKVVASVPGSAMAIPINVVKLHGFMDTSFFLYGEDSEYCLRLFQKGIPSIIVPESQVIHERGGSGLKRRGLSAIMHYYRTRGRLIIYREYVGRWRYFLEVIRMSFFVFVCCTRVFKDGSQALLSGYYTLIGIYDGVQGKRGKRFAPEDYF